MSDSNDFTIIGLSKVNSSIVGPAVPDFADKLPFAPFQRNKPIGLFCINMFCVLHFN